MAWSFRKALGWDDNPYVDPLDAALGGADKPSIILLDMVLADLIKNAKEIHFQNNGGGSYSFGYDNADLKLKVRWMWEWKNNEPTGSYQHGKVRAIEVLFDGRTFNLTADEYKRFKIGARKAILWKKDYDRNKSEMDRQELAVKHIEEFFKPKVIPAPEPSVELVSNVPTTELEETCMESPATRRAKK